MKRGHEPIRTCVACRRRRPQKELIRLKLDGEAAVISPSGENRPGRGCYICPNGQCIEKIRKRGIPERAFRKRRVVPPAEEELLRRLE